MRDAEPPKPVMSAGRPGILRRLGRRLPIVALCGLLVICALEAAVRIDDFLSEGALPWDRHSLDALFQPTQYGRGGVPGARFSKWAINSHGFVGPEPLDGRERILVYGSSEAFGLYESPSHAFPRLVQARLERLLPGRFDVVNLALPGMRIGHTEYLKHALDTLPARYVVIYPSPAAYIGVTAPYCGQPTRPVPNAIGLADRIRLIRKLDTLLKAHAPAALLDWMRDWSLQREIRRVQVVTTLPQSVIDAFQADLHCVADVIRSHGATPVFVTHATWFRGQSPQASEPMLRQWRRFYPELAEPGFLDLEQRANEVIRREAQAANAPLVEAAESMPGGSDYFADFVHFTDAGAEHLAGLIAVAIGVARQASTDAPMPATSTPIPEHVPANDGSRQPPAT